MGVITAAVQAAKEEQAGQGKEAGFISMMGVDRRNMAGFLGKIINLREGKAKHSNTDRKKGPRTFLGVWKLTDKEILLVQMGTINLAVCRFFSARFGYY